MKSKLSIVKIGGNSIDNQKILDSFLSDFSQLKEAKILIHGGGKIASDFNEKLGIKTSMNEGRRITSSENLETITMIYAGLINKTIVSKLQGNDCNAIGLSGSDANCILAAKRPVTPIDFGWVGDVKFINSKTINLFLNNGIVPVFCAISHDGNGQLLNTNADTVAAEIAIAMSEEYTTELIYCFEKNGVLMDVNDDTSVLDNINSKKYSELKKANIISGGMLPKLENCFHALENKVTRVIIGNSKVLNDTSELHTTLLL